MMRAVKRYREAVVFDALGTVFNPSPLEKLLGGKTQFDAWFGRLLHSSLALTTLGEWRPFEQTAESTLAATLARSTRSVSAAAVLEALARVPAYPDADDAFAALEEAGVTIGVLTNGAERATTKLLELAGLADRVAEVVSVEELELFKPHPAAYKHAAERLGAQPANVTVISAHAWDVAGAKAAGLKAVWVDRLEREWPLPRGKPRTVADGLVAAAELALAKR
jgi:2-haloacid dehalogenase